LKPITVGGCALFCYR